MLRGIGPGVAPETMFGVAAGLMDGVSASKSLLSATHAHTQIPSVIRSPELFAAPHAISHPRAQTA
eukprot:1532269-Rhodomonas_salina.1